MREEDRKVARKGRCKVEQMKSGKIKEREKRKVPEEKIKERKAGKGERRKGK